MAAPTLNPFTPIPTSEPTPDGPLAAPGLTPSAVARVTGVSGAPPPSSASAPAPPTFAELLQQSLVALNDTRAWFDEARGYAVVRQTRTPTRLPQVGRLLDA